MLSSPGLSNTTVISDFFSLPPPGPVTEMGWWLRALNVSPCPGEGVELGEHFFDWFSLQWELHTGGLWSEKREHLPPWLPRQQAGTVTGRVGGLASGKGLQHTAYCHQH